MQALFPTRLAAVEENVIVIRKWITWRGVPSIISILTITVGDTIFSHFPFSEGGWKARRKVFGKNVVPDAALANNGTQYNKFKPVLKFF